MRISGNFITGKNEPRCGRPIRVSGGPLVLDHEMILERMNNYRRMVVKKEGHVSEGGARSEGLPEM